MSEYIVDGGKTVDGIDLNKNDSMYVYGGGVANGVTAKNTGWVEVSSGGTANDVTISSGGIVYLRNSGTVNGLKLKPDGTLKVSSGGRLTGKLDFGGGVTVYQGAILDFDLTQTAPLTAALVNDFAYVTGLPFTYTLTVDASLANGDYYLADDAWDFADTLSVVNTSGEALGTLTVDGEAVYKSGKMYTLSMDASYLTVTVGDPPANIFTGDLENATKYIDAGSSALDVNVNFMGRLHIHDGAVAIDTTLNYLGDLYVSEGGKASNTTVNSTGGLYVSEGGVASNTTVNSGGDLYVSEGGVASNTTVNEYGYLYVSEGGVASNTTVNSGGDLYVSEGGVASNTTVNSGGYFFVESGVAINTTVNSTGGLYVSEGGVVIDTTVNSQGQLEVSCGVASDTTVNSGGKMTVDWDGAASNTTVKFGGKMYVSSGGVANGVTVSSGCLVAFNAPDGGGRLTGKMTFETGAIPVFVLKNATVDFDLRQTSADADPLLNDFSFVTDNKLSFTLTVNGTQADGVYKLAGNAADFGGRTITVVNASGETLGTLTVDGKRVFNNSVLYTLGMSDSTLAVTVTKFPDNIFTGDLENASKYINAGSSSVDVNVNSMGRLYISNGGVASNTTVNSQGQLEVSGGVASNTTLNSRSDLYVYSGGKAIDTVASGSNGDLHIGKGGVANNTVLVGSNCDLYVSDGGVAIDTTVGSDCELQIFSGGVASNVTVSAGGLIYLNDIDGGGGTVTGKMTFEPGAGHVTVYSIGTVDFDLRQTTADADPLLNDFSFVTDENLSFTLTVDGTQADGVYKLAGNAADFGGRTITVVNASDETLGTLTVDGKRVFNNSVLYTLGMSDSTLAVTVTKFPENIFTGDLENETKIIYAGSSAVDVNVNSMGRLYISNGGVASNTTVNEYGYLYVSEGGVASNTTLNDECIMYVRSSGIASNTMLNSGANLFVSEGGVASNTTFNSGGYLQISSGGVARNTIVTQGAVLEIYIDGVASDVTVSFGGIVAFNDASYGGGKLTGKMTFEAGAWHVGGVDDAVIDFDLRQTKADADPLLNDFSFVTDSSLSFTLTVDGTQADGVYKLAGNAADFGGRTITVVNASDETLGTLTLSGEGVEIGGKKYTLILDNTTLAVLVGDPDSTPPTVTGVKADITDPTNGNVTVTAVFADETELKSSLYRLDDGDWKAYPDGGVVVGKNATVSFKAVDAAGNESAEVSYAVTNIDKTPPANPTASADVTAPTNGNVTVTAVFSDDSAKKEYSLDGTNWLTYTQPIPFAENGTAYFRGTDAAGNLSGEVSYAVTNIDKTPPANPTASADVTAPTDDKVTVSARFSDDSAKKEYSLDGTTWQAYTGPVSFTSNGTAYFRGTDAAGNVSGITKYEVGNIQKGVDEPLNDWLYDKKTKEVNTNVMSSYGTHLNAAGTEIRLDRIGSINVDGCHNRVEKAVKGEEHDTVDYVKIVLENGAKLSFHAEATAAATFTVYSLTQNAKGKYTLKKLQTLKLKDKDKDGVFTADSKKPLPLQTSGAYYVSMEFKDKKAEEAFYNVTLNGEDAGCCFYLDDDSGWNDYLYDKKAKTVNPDRGVFLSTDIQSGVHEILLDDKGTGGYKDGETTWSNFVGFGDNTDFARIVPGDPAKVSFSVTAKGASKFTVYSLTVKGTDKKTGQTLYSMKKVKTIALKKDKETGLYYAPANELLLDRLASDSDPNVGYYVSMQATSVKKAPEAYYTVTADSHMYAYADDGRNKCLYDKKADPEHYNPDLHSNTIDSGSNPLCLEVGGSLGVTRDIGDETRTYANFVGFGDGCDYAELAVTSAGTLSFTVDAFSDGDARNAGLKFTVYSLTRGVKGEKTTWSMKNLASQKIAVDKETGYVESVQVKKSVTIKEISEDVRYFVSMQSTGAKKGAEVFYNVTAMFLASETAADALSMPETDTLGISDALSFGQYDADALASASASALDDLDDKSGWQSLLA